MTNKAPETFEEAEQEYYKQCRDGNQFPLFKPIAKWFWDAATDASREREVRLVADAVHNINWLPLTKKLSGYFKEFGQEIHPNKIVLFIERELEDHNRDEADKGNYKIKG